MISIKTSIIEISPNKKESIITDSTKFLSYLLHER